MDRFLSEHKYSEITEEFPDREKYPLYYEASRHEFTIGPGEMLFIPAGWFHFVFSEGDELNFALNYWYHPENGWEPGHSSCLLPRIENHKLHNLAPSDIFGNKVVICTKSELDGLFPSNRTFHRFPGKVHNEYMTFDEFYETKNPKYYIVQGEETNITQFAPKYSKDLYSCSAWVNFGNCRSLMHYDEHDNWLCQIRGKKRVLLFPHEDRHLLYMFNPTPMNIIREANIYKNAPTYFISKRVFEEYLNISDYYSKEIERYKDTILKVAGTGLPEFKPPTKFTTHTMNGQNYSKIQNYPLYFFLFTGGKGIVNLNSRGRITLNKGDLLIFPNHFTFPWTIEGNLKFIVPE